VAIEDPMVNGQIEQASSLARLSPGQKNVEFRYSGMSFIAPTSTTYRYKLDGYDKDWIDAADRREAIYTNLPPGKYRFHVVACSPGGQCSQKESAVDFELASNYYQRGWFFPLMATLAALAGWLGYRFRMGQLRAKYDLIVNERSRIARE